LVFKEPISINISGIIIGIYSGDIELREKFEAFFSDYIVKSKPQYAIIIEGAAKDLCPPLPYGLPVVVESWGGYFSIIKKLDDGNIVLANINGNTTECTFDLKTGVSYSDVISVLRTYIHFLIERQGGFWLHASCGKINGRAYIFTGKHNAGKSTALKNLKPDRTVAEDCLAVRFIDGKPGVFSTPFRKEDSSTGIANAVIFPRKTRKVLKLIEDNLSRSFSEVTANTMFSAPENKDIVNIVMNNILKFCTVVPAYTLYSTKTADLRKVVA
jgi:hypothetical protein